MSLDWLRGSSRAPAEELAVVESPHAEERVQGPVVLVALLDVAQHLVGGEQETHLLLGAPRRRSGRTSGCISFARWRNDFLISWAVEFWAMPRIS